MAKKTTNDKSAAASKATSQAMADVEDYILSFSGFVKSLSPLFSNFQKFNSKSIDKAEQALNLADKESSKKTSRSKASKGKGSKKGKEKASAKKDEASEESGKWLETGIDSVYKSIGKATGSLLVQIPALGLEAEQTTAAYTTMTGSAEAATRTIDTLSEFATKTPYGRAEVLEAGKQMLAFGFDADTLTTKLSTIGNVAAGVGMPLDEMAKSFAAIGPNGQASTSDLEAFSSRGIPIFDELAKVMGMSVKEVKGLAEESKVSFSDVEQAFANMGGAGGKYYNSMETLSNTTGARQQVMFDKLTVLGEKVGIAMLPLIDAFSRFAINLATQLTQAVDYLVPVFGFLGNNLEWILPVVLALTSAMGIYSLMQKVSAAYTAVSTIGLWAYNTAMWAVGTAMLAYEAVSKAVMSVQWAQHAATLRNTIAQVANYGATLVMAGAQWALRAATVVMTGVQWALNAALAANPIGLVVLAVVALVAILAVAWNNSETFRNIVLSLWEGLKQLWDVFVGVALAIWEWSPPIMMIRAQIEALISVIQWLWPIIKDIFGKVKAWIVDTFGGAIDSIVGAVKSLFAFFSKLASAMGLDKIVNNIQSAFKTGEKIQDDKTVEDPAVDDVVKNEAGAVDALGDRTSLSKLGWQTQGTQDTTSMGLTGVQSQPAAARSVTVNIERFMDSFTVSTTNLKEGASELKRVILETFVEAVRDFETNPITRP